MKFQLKLPSIQPPGSQQGGGAVVVGDWLALVTPVLQGLSTTSGRWWRQVLERAQALYARWLSATPLDRLGIKPNEHEDRYPVGTYCRVEARAVTLLLEVLPEELRADVVACRVITCVAVLFAVFKRFQPGGPSERAGLLSYLSQGQEAGTATEAAQLLRQWPGSLAPARRGASSVPPGSEFTSGGARQDSQTCCVTASAQSCRVSHFHFPKQQGFGFCTYSGGCVDVL